MARINIEIDEEMFTKLMIRELRSQLNIVRSNIKPINKKMKECQIIDIKDAKETVEHLEYILKYYGG